MKTQRQPVDRGRHPGVAHPSPRFLAGGGGASLPVFGEERSDPGKSQRYDAKILPHRYPFLMVDRITELEPGQRLLALKNVTCNEPFFVGHWPGRPVMPGVLILEALAQAAGILIAQKFDPERLVAMIVGPKNSGRRAAATVLASSFGLKLAELNPGPSRRRPTCWPC